VAPDGLQNAILSTVEINGNKTSNEKKLYDGITSALVGIVLSMAFEALDRDHRLDHNP
jgi:hypothetical protein